MDELQNIINLDEEPLSLLELPQQDMNAEKVLVNEMKCNNKKKMKKMLKNQEDALKIYNLMRNDLNKVEYFETKDSIKANDGNFFFIG